jgi:predicted Zn-dependent protease
MSRIRPIIPMAAILTVLAVGAFGVARFLWWTEPREAMEAREAVADGRYDEAGKALTRWLRAVPDACDMTVRHSRGLALMRLGRADEARAEQAAASVLRKDLDRLNEARSRLIASPTDRQSQLEIARWMFDHAHEQEGLRWAQKILVDRPDDPEAGRLLADYHQRRGDTGLANFYRLHSSTGPEPSPVAKQGDRR